LVREVKVSSERIQLNKKNHNLLSLYIIYQTMYTDAHTCELISAQVKLFKVIFGVNDSLHRAVNE
jgi:hypothetical protein